MTMSSRVRRAVGAALLLTAATPATAHSWVDQLMRVATNGTMIGTPGFIRGYVEHGGPGFTDSMDNYLIPPNGRTGGKVILETDNICHPSQTVGNYSSEFPRLTTASGDVIALRYQENGHVTSPGTQKGKPDNRGTVYIYGTNQPSNNDTLLSIHKVWTADGQGGDGRGRLLSTRNFDDGQCYQVNPNSALSQQRIAEFPKEAEAPQGADLWCQSDLQLPTDLETGSGYTLYWVWDWPTLKDSAGNQSDPNNIETPELYTSCIELNLVDPCSDDLGSVKSPACTNQSDSSIKLAQPLTESFVKNQDRNNIAIFDQMSSNFDVAVPDESGSSDSVTSTSRAGTASASDAVPTTLQTKTKSSGHTRGMKTVTVTVTDDFVTVTVTETDGPSATTSPVAAITTTAVVADGDAASTVQSDSNPPAVTPFTRAKRSPRRAVGDRRL